MPARKHLRLTPAADPMDDLRDLLAAMTPDQVGEFCATLDEVDLELVELVMSGLRHAKWVPRPHQVPPDPDDHSWDVWLLLAGRGAGKTDACAHEMDRHAKGPACFPGVPGGHRMAIIAPTLGDASDACVHGPSGLMAHNPTVVERTRKGGTFVSWPNGAEAKLFGAYTKQDVERLRAGGNRCFVWVEELAAWRYLRACWNHMMFGLRLGAHPRVIASTTPKNRPHLRKLIAADTTRISRATTDDNPHLDKRVRQRLLDVYAGTRLGRQELLGQMLEDVEGALWNDEMLETWRLLEPDEPPRMRRITVAVDPSWGTTNDECGIVVAGVGWNGHGYVLADYSIRGGPRAWAERAAEAYWTYQADRLVAEGNFQGEQVRLAMGQVQHPQGPPMFDLVNASRGKQLRAEPVVMLYEQGKVHHVGRLTLLEHQMTTWVPTEPPEETDDDEAGELVTQAGRAEGDGESETDDDEQLPSGFSPDRVDALVFALTDLMLGSTGPASFQAPGKTKPKRRTAGDAPRPAAPRGSGASLSRPRRR